MKKPTLYYAQEVYVTKMCAVTFAQKHLLFGMIYRQAQIFKGMHKHKVFMQKMGLEVTSLLDGKALCLRQRQRFTFIQFRIVHQPVGIAHPVSQGVQLFESSCSSGLIEPAGSANDIVECFLWCGKWCCHLVALKQSTFALLIP